MTPGSSPGALSNASTSAALTIESVTFAFRAGEDVVRSVSAAVEPGAVTALLGPNGAGKSTLLRLMLGHLRPTSGRVTLGGESVHRLAPRDLAERVAYVPQRSAVSFAFSVRQVVEMGRYALRRDADAVDAALDACDLNALADRAYVELSVGQQQRVLLARALAQSAGGGRVVLADEPTAAMDLAHVHGTMRRLRELAKGRGVAVVVVAQDINLAARYADRVWLMDNGALAADGAWRDVLDPATLTRVYGIEVRRVTTDGPERRILFDVGGA